VITQCRANTRACRAAISPVSSAIAATVRWSTKPRRGGRPATGPTSSRWCQSANAERRKHAPPSAWRPRAAGPAAAPSPCPPCPTGRRAGRAALVHPPVDLDEPGVELILEVQLVGKPPAGLEVRFGVALQAFDGPLACRSAGSQKHQSTFSWPRRTPHSGDRRGRGCQPDDSRPASWAGHPDAAGSRRSPPAGPRSASRRPGRRRPHASSPNTR